MRKSQKKAKLTTQNSGPGNSREMTLFQGKKKNE